MESMGYIPLKTDIIVLVKQLMPSYCHTAERNSQVTSKIIPSAEQRTAKQLKLVYLASQPFLFEVSSSYETRNRNLLSLPPTFRDYRYAPTQPFNLKIRALKMLSENVLGM